MTVTETREHPSRVRTIRMFDASWDVMEARTPALRSDPSKYTRDMTEAGFEFARCYRCFQPVPVEFRDVTGKPLAQWVEEAGRVVTAQHREGHHPVVIGGTGAEWPADTDAAAVLRDRLRVTEMHAAEAEAARVQAEARAEDLSRELRNARARERAREMHERAAAQAAAEWAASVSGDEAETAAPAPGEPPPATAVFMEPGGKPVITAPVPDRKKGPRT